MATFRGDKLREAREAAEMSRLKLAANLDVTQATVENWESGKQVPSGQVLADLADALGLDLTELFDQAPVADGSYRTHSKVSSSTYMEAGQAQEQAELAKLLGDHRDAEDEHMRAMQAYRSADSWDRDTEAARLKAAGDRLSALSLKLQAYKAS